jgi:hypothetical protein
MNHTMPSEDLKMRLLGAIEATPAPTREEESKRAAWIVGGALLLSMVAFIGLGGVRMTDRATPLVIGTVGGTATIAALALWAALGRGRTMLGRSSSLLTAVVIASPIALLAWKVLWSAQYDHGIDRWPSRLGLKCLAISLALGALPLGALLFSRRGTDAVHPGRAGLGIGVGIGLAAATLVDAWCPVAYLPHLLLGHLLPLSLLGALGLFLGRKMLAP